MPLIAMAVLAASAATAAESHLQQNSVYRELVEQGVITDEASHQLPAPTLPDGMSLEAQVQSLEQLGGTRYPFARLTRKSVVAPQIIRVPTVPKTEGIRPLRTVDVWFVVHAEMDQISDPDFLGELLNTESDNGQANALTAAELQARGISIAKEDAEREAFGHLVYILLDKVQIRATGHSCWTQTEESIVGAVVVDSRFREDDEYPNHWILLDQRSEPNPADRTVPYDGLGFYVKVTKLKRPAGALFVEFHLVFAEPLPWFRGTNQLGAKLPAVLQAQVRSARREMMRASQEVDEGS